MGLFPHDNNNNRKAVRPCARVYMLVISKHPLTRCIDGLQLLRNSADFLHHAGINMRNLVCITTEIGLKLQL